jgi:hypothetical protein
MIKSRRMSWMGRELEIRIKFWSKNLKGKIHSEDLGADDKIILKQILGK